MEREFTMITAQTDTLRVAGINENPEPDCRHVDGKPILSRQSVMLIPVPSSLTDKAGFDENTILLYTAEKGRLVITAHVCDGNCEDCPLEESDCEGNCENCPCRNYCEESEAQDDE